MFLIYLAIRRFKQHRQRQPTSREANTSLELSSAALIDHESSVSDQQESSEFTSPSDNSQADIYILQYSLTPSRPTNE